MFLFGWDKLEFQIQERLLKGNFNCSLVEGKFNKKGFPCSFLPIWRGQSSKNQGNFAGRKSQLFTYFHCNHYNRGNQIGQLCYQLDHRK